MRVVTVSSDPALHEVVRSRLGADVGVGAGMSVVAAGSVYTALPLVAAHMPDAVLVDLLAPAPNGLSVARRLRDFWPDIPAILVSADDVPGCDAMARATGAAGFLSLRRLAPDTLTAMVSRRVGRHMAGAPALAA